MWRSLAVTVERRFIASLPARVRAARPAAAFWLAARHAVQIKFNGPVSVAWTPNRLQNSGRNRSLRARVSGTNMMQIVIGAALGYLLAHGVLVGARRIVGWLRLEPVRTRLLTLSSAAGPTLVGGFIKYAGVVGVIAALVTLGFWAVGDYRAAKSARSAAAADALFARAAPPIAAPRVVPEEVVESTSTADTRPRVAPRGGRVDPYEDPDFKVHRRAHRAGSAGRVEETLVRRSEVKARAELLSETRLHARRSQYDCEASDRAERYLKADLDVWGFAAWQMKYFPVAGYRGATLPLCKDIKDVVDPARAHWQSSVAREDHR
jgi:hypothetical protein